jgi:hypothetical protein
MAKQETNLMEEKRFNCNVILKRRWPSRNHAGVCGYGDSSGGKRLGLHYFFMAQTNDLAAKDCTLPAPRVPQSK